jgi:hypothetical protein
MFALVLFASSATAEPAALARASVSTRRTIWVGQRVTIVVELLTPGLFATAPSFDLPRVSGAILIPPETRPIVGTETIDGTSYTTQRHELTVFAQRAGTVRIPAFPIRFESSPAFGKPATAQTVATPAVAFMAMLPPGAEQLATVISTEELHLTEAWEPEPGKVPAEPGTAFTRTITIEARDVVGMLLPALPFGRTDGLAVYAKTPEVEERRERGETTGRRVETATYVCEKAGRFTLPALVVRWWDLKSQKLRQSELPSRAFEVSPGPSANEQRAPEANPGNTRFVSVLASAVSVGVVAVVALCIQLWRKRHHQVDGASESAYFAAFVRACRGNDAVSTLRTLLAWLNRFPEHHALFRAEQLAARSGDPELTVQLTTLDNAAFGSAGPDSRPWSSGTLLQAVRRARKRLATGKKSAKPRRAILPPLNPSDTLPAF